MKQCITIILMLLSPYIIAQDFGLKNGDLIFQEACSGSMGNSIKEVTTSIDNYQFTHVGIVYIGANDSIYVLEATRPKVVLTPLSQYLYPVDTKGCYPKSVAGRLKAQYRSLIPKALEIGFTLIGKEYDYGFVLGNGKYYCSELVYEILRQANNGKEVFPLNVMTFKSEDTGLTTQGWIEYFDDWGLPVPEGELGINPGAMSQSDVIDIIHIF